MRKLMMENIKEKLEWCDKNKTLEELLETQRFKIVKVVYRTYIPEGPIDFDLLSDSQFLTVFEVFLKRFYTQM